MNRLHCVLAGALALACLPACSSEEEPEQVLPPHCNPILADHCMLPWPSTFFLTRDSRTPTGYRVDYPAEKLLPVSATGTKLAPARYNVLDGFSVGSQPIVYFAEGLSSDGLPTRDRLAESVTDSSLIAIIEYDSGTRVPLFAELDANAKQVVPGLIIRPQRPLKFNTRHVVVLRKGLRAADGSLLQAPAPFARIRDDRGTSSETLRAEGERLQQVLAFLDKQNIPRAEVVLAWDFHTSSREAVTGNLGRMVTRGLARLGAGGPAYSGLIVRNQDPTETDLLRQIDGTMEVPSFLASDADDAWLKVDGDGRPVYRGMQKAPFHVHIPRCAEQATGPLPVLVFGHGLFGDTRTMASSYHKKLHNRLCMVEVNTPWWGLSSADVPFIASDVVTNWTNLPRVTDRVQQAQLNMHTLVELMSEGSAFLNDPALQVGGKPVTDGKQLYYLGISNGGIQGVAFAALNKRIERYVFNVPGGWWSMMLERSSDFKLLAMLLEKVYPDPLDRLLLIAMSQHLWDYTDPIAFADHLIGSPLPGHAAKRIAVQEGRHDDQVPNISTRAVVRAIGLPALRPVVESVYGVAEKDGPLDSAYTQWDTRPPVKPPGTNVPAPKPDDADSAHKVVRTLDTAIKQMEQFYKPTGKVVHPCGGPCGST